MSVLMKSISGIRGIVGETVTPELVVTVGAAFAKYASQGKIVLGRDSRPTGEMISHILGATLQACGCEVVDIGIVPTPTVQIMVEELKAAGGIVISASHNPIEWNAFKLINKSGTFLNSVEIKKFFAFMEGGFNYMKWNKVGTVSTADATGVHIDKIVKIINKKAIKKKKYKIALDSVNGAGSEITPKMLKILGCKVFPLYCDMNGIFPRVAEPLPENLGDLSEIVVKTKADIGFAQDPDADRLAIVDETGRPIGEEYTIALVTEHLLSKKKGNVIVNLSTTKAVEDIAGRHNVDFYRAKVGEINVVDEMRKRGARIGGEGNGGVISPEVHLGRDSLVGIAYVLEMMAERNKKLSELVAELPAYVMKKGKVSVANISSAKEFAKIEQTYKSEKISRIDGLRIDFKKDEKFMGGWVHLRSSNTEPIFRIITEGRDQQQATLIYNHFAAMFSKKKK